MIVKNMEVLLNGVKDAFNEEGKRNNRNTHIRKYNCMGYATQTYSWACPYDTDEEDKMFFSMDKDTPEDECVEATAENMLKGFKGRMRRVKSLDEIKDDEYGVLYKTGGDDFHFIKYFPKSKYFFHKPGSSEIRRIGRHEALSDVWTDGWNTYDSKTIFFAMKNNLK